MYRLEEMLSLRISFEMFNFFYSGTRKYIFKYLL